MTKDVTFVFDDYQVIADSLAFHYSYRDAGGTVIGRFEESYTLPQPINANDPVVQYVLQQLHVILGVSYYKSLLGQVELPYKVSPAEAEYYNTVYHEGLGEFAYINKLTEPIRPFRSDSRQDRAAVPLQLAGGLLGIGGGKDSIVAAELLKACELDVAVLDVATRENRGQAGAVMDASGLRQLTIGRYVDTGIVGFTQKHGGMNGHVPFSVFLAWLGVLMAVTSGRKYVMMANEAATSSGNVEWNGREVNHQWAKSFDAEKLTLDFIHRHISPDLWYFSPIRPYGSLAVMALFVQLGQPYYGVFTSCNLVLRIDPNARPNGRWCTQCAKCLSTWLLLSPWMTIAQMDDIFGRNLYTDETLRPTLEALLGLSGHKPLDCVGTTEELRAVTRRVLERGDQWPLLAGITADMIPGPSIIELATTLHPANLPPELVAGIGDVVAANL